MIPPDVNAGWAGDVRGGAGVLLAGTVDWLVRENARLNARVLELEKIRISASPATVPTLVVEAVPPPVVPARGVSASFNGDEPLDAPLRLHARSGPGAPVADVDADEKNESLRRLVALMIAEGHRESDAEAAAMRWHGNPRLRMAVASVELKKARGKEAGAKLAIWLCKNPGELGEKGSGGNWREIDEELRTARPEAPRVAQGGRTSRPALESIPTPDDRIESREDKRLMALAHAEFDRIAAEKGKR